MSNSNPTTQITLLGHTYTISCAAGEEEALLRSGRYLDHALEGIKARARTANHEKVALMAALNISHELLSALDAQKAQAARLKRLGSQLDNAVDRARASLSR